MDNGNDKKKISNGSVFNCGTSLQKKIGLCLSLSFTTRYTVAWIITQYVDDIELKNIY